MESLQDKIYNDPGSIQYGVDVLNEQVYDIVYDLYDRLCAGNDGGFTTEEHDYLAKCVLEKCLQQYRNITPAQIPIVVPNPAIIPIANEVPTLKIELLRDNLYVEDKESLLLTFKDNKLYCLGVYDKKTKETLPLTDEQRKYCESCDFTVV